jgi:hypothetical protein
LIEIIINLGNVQLNQMSLPYDQYILGMWNPHLLRLCLGVLRGRRGKVKRGREEKGEMGKILLLVSISSLKDAQKVVESGLSIGWGQVVTLPENNHGESLGFFPSSAKANG